MELKKRKTIRIEIFDEDFSKCSRSCEYQTDDIWGHHDFCMHYMDGTTSKRRLPECIQEFGIPEVKNGEIQ